MKKISKLFMLLTLVLFLATGCVKYNVSMEAKDDKSVTLEILYGMEVDNSMMGEDTDTDSTTDTTEEESDDGVEAEDYKYLEDAGFKVEEYLEEKEDTTIAGVKITKTFANIDEITSDTAFELDFNDVMDEEKKDSLKDVKYFYKKDGAYVANFVFDFKEDGDDMDYTDYQSMFDMVYTIKLPREAVSNNATKVSDDKLTYTWDLDYGVVNKVEYSFKLAEKKPAIIGTDKKENNGTKKDNNLVIIAAVVGGVALLAVIIVLATKKKKPAEYNVQPVQPVAPGMPVTPAVPATPANETLTTVNPMPATPVAPMVEAPVAPVAPMAEAPVAPVAQPVVEPVAPVAPVAQPVVEPVAPVAPAPQPMAEPVAPVAPVAPTAPVAPMPTEPAAPVVDNQNM